MPAFLAANPYLGIEDPDARKLYLLFAAIFALVLILATLRGLAKLKEQRKVRESSWRSLRKGAKVRGLSSKEVDTLTSMVKRAGLKRPSQILGSIQVFDRCVDRAQEERALSEKEHAQLDSIREKLLSNADQWDGRDRRQLERIECSIAMEMVLLPEEAIKEELRSTIHEDDPKFKEVLRELRAELNTAGAHVQNIGAGGLALLISHEGEAREGDYVLLEEGSADPPLALGGLMGQIVAVEKMATPRQALLHLRFLPYDQALRREIIQMVYQQQEAPPELSAAGRKKRPSAPPKSD